jgi:hypothetical protein
MRKVMVAAALFGAFAVMAPGVALARPGYKTAFLKNYEVKPGANLEKASCGVCHAGPDKKLRNFYGFEVLKVLGKAEATDAELVAAVKKVENNLSADKKTKFIELIKADKVPAELKPYPAPEAKPAG